MKQADLRVLGHILDLLSDEEKEKAKKILELEFKEVEIVGDNELFLCQLHELLF